MGSDTAEWAAVPAGMGSVGVNLCVLAVRVAGRMVKIMEAIMWVRVFISALFSVVYGDSLFLIMIRLQRGLLNLPVVLGHV